jgi:hypothetical protein
VTGAIAYRVPLGGNLGALFYLDGRWNSEYRTQTLNRQRRSDGQRVLRDLQRPHWHRPGERALVS